MLAFLKTGKFIPVTLAAAALLSACASPVSDDSALRLGEGQGLIGIELVTVIGGVDYQVKITGGAFGKMLRMDDVPKGESVYLYKLPAGRYCIQSLYLTGSDKYLDPVGSKPCFVVAAGKLTYAGTLDNSFYGFYSVDMSEFLQALKQLYPKVYKHYVKGPKPVKKPLT